MKATQCSAIKSTKSQLMRNTNSGCLLVSAQWRNATTKKWTNKKWIIYGPHNTHRIFYIYGPTQGWPTYCDISQDHKWTVAIQSAMLIERGTGQSDPHSRQLRSCWFIPMLVPSSSGQTTIYILRWKMVKETHLHIWVLKNRVEIWN